MDSKYDRLNDPAKREPLVAALLSWYDREARSLPWRNGADGYGVLVSEFMLQQTQVATVIPYWHRFMERFPTPAALAEAAEDEVLRVWEGLGYYGRARRLHQAAQHIQARFAGRVPTRVEELRELPGVGAYTAGAVASIAFGRRASAVDGNVLRVLARLLAVTDAIDRAAVKRRLAAVADDLVPQGRPGDFNQALMELGALVCTPKKPACGLCPLQAFCAAWHEDMVAQLPVRLRGGTPPQRVPVAVIVAIDRMHGEDWAAALRESRLLVVRRPRSGLLGGLWALPTIEVDGASAAQEGEGRQAASSLLERAQWPCRLTTSALHTLEHVFSHRRWLMEAWGAVGLWDGNVEEWPAQMAQALGVPAGEVRWADAHERSQLALPRPYRRLLSALENDRVSLGLSFGPTHFHRPASGVE